ncbi:MAG: hypothetical protein S4CHLAM6_15830 [Chlamydiae bacterium]|nr:hypothetical protein [Chlamydiota bacterium]
MISKEIFKNIKRIQIRTNKYVQDVLAGAYHSAFKGRGMEFEDVREYQPGDEARSIDWNVTARMQYPFVKNFREERELTVILLVDVSASSLFGTTGRKKSELIAELGALFSLSAINNNDKVGLILFSDQVEKFLPPQKGLKHAMRVIRELLVFKPEGRKTDIAKALTFLGKIQKRKSVVFLISDFLSPDFKDELAVIGKRHDLIGVNVRDPHERTLPKVGLLQLKDLESAKTLIVDTSKKKIREMLASRSKKIADELRKMFDMHADGLIHVHAGKPYMESVNEFFCKRRVSR